MRGGAGEDAGGEELETNEIRRERQEGRETGDEEAGANYLGTNLVGGEDGGNKDSGGVFTCVLDHLEPGTTYLLEIRSQSDAETANLTVHTSKSS